MKSNKTTTKETTTKETTCKNCCRAVIAAYNISCKYCSYCYGK